MTYGELVGDKPFHLAFTGTAPVKSTRRLQMVGTPVPRNDLPDKVSGKYVYMQHVRVPGMLHGRVVRPRGQGAYGAGAKVMAVDEGRSPIFRAHACCARAILLAWSLRTNGTRCAPRNN